MGPTQTPEQTQQVIAAVRRAVSELSDAVQPAPTALAA
jgi:hypothetical protein